MDQPLGFDKDAIINVPFRVDSRSHQQAGLFKETVIVGKRRAGSKLQFQHPG